LGEVGYEYYFLGEGVVSVRDKMVMFGSRFAASIVITWARFGSAVVGSGFWANISLNE
jgi:hypothetical protein